jgi:hypothetical protein
MGVSIQSLLHFENILKTIALIKGGVPGGILSERMFQATDTTTGNEGSYFKVSSTRQVAQAVAYGAPSVAAKMPGVVKQAITLIHTFEHFQHEPNLLALLKSENMREQERGAELVGRALAEFVRRFVNLRRAAWYSALTLGHIYLDGDGNLLPSSSGAAIDIDFGIPAGNKGQLDWDGNGAIIGASWGTAGTDIQGDVEEIKIASIQMTGYRITKAYYGSNIPAYIGGNTVMKEFLKEHPASVDQMVAGRVPNGFLGLDWERASEAFYSDKDGTARFFWGGDTVVFTPDPNDIGWWGLVDGSYNIPTNVGNMYQDVVAALESLTKVFGMFGYAQVTNDPVGVRQYAGDTFLPTINVPKSVFISDVTP